MKKLMTVAVASAFAFLAIGAVNGDEILLPSGTSVEAYTGALRHNMNDAGTAESSRYWFLIGDDNAELLVTNYESSVELPPRPEQFDGEPNDNYLKIDTNGRLYRSIGVNSQTLDTFPTTNIVDGIYLDTLVQFTAADDEFKDDAIVAGDKIAIEYVEREEERDNNDKITVTAMTNFVVRAAYVDAANSKIVATNYYLTFPGQSVNAVQFDKTKWHRLTVRAISNVGNTYAPVGFVVYVDGTNLVYDASVAAGDDNYVGSLNSVVKTYLYNDETHSLLPSLLRYGETGYDTLSAVAFNGNGCVDDISFTADKPGILPNEGMTVTIAWDDKVASYTVVAGETTIVDGEAVSGEGSTNLLLSAGITAITVTATYADGYEAGAWSASAGTLNNGVWTFENGATLTINSLYPYFQVGDAYYEEFDGENGALAAAIAGSGVIKLNADYPHDISLTEGTVTIDLAGKTITGDSLAAIMNGGADLIITNSTVEIGHIVKPSGPDTFAILIGGGTTSIYGGWVDGLIEFDTSDLPQDLLFLYGGYYNDASTTDPASFYRNDCARDVVSYVDDPAYYFQVGSDTPEPPAPTSVEVPTAIEGLIYNKGEQTGVAAGTGYTLTGNVGTNAGSYTAIATLQEGYAWVGGSTDPTNIVWYIGMKTVTNPTVVLTPSSATFDSGKAKVGDYTSVAVYDGEDLLTEDLDYYVSNALGLDQEVTAPGEFTVEVIQKAWSEGQNYMINSASATLTITAGGAYPTYIENITDPAVKAEYEDLYDDWATAYTVADGSGYEAAFLLNVDPVNGDATLAVTSITISGGKIVITSNQPYLNKLNGKVYIKTAATLTDLESASWSAATLSEDNTAVEMTPNGTAAFFKIKVDF